MDAETVGRNLHEEDDICTISNSRPIKYLLITYKLISALYLLINLTVTKPGRQHLNQVLKVDIPSNGTD